jgi:hypothetical protein
MAAVRRLSWSLFRKDHRSWRKTCTVPIINRPCAVEACRRRSSGTDSRLSPADDWGDTPESAREGARPSGRGSRRDADVGGARGWRSGERRARVSELVHRIGRWAVRRTAGAVRRSAAGGRSGGFPCAGGDHCQPERPRSRHRAVAQAALVCPLLGDRAVAGVQGAAPRRDAERIWVQLAWASHRICVRAAGEDHDQAGRQRPAECSAESGAGADCR